MTDSRWLQTLPLSAALFVSACLNTPGGIDDTEPVPGDTVVRMLPMHPTGALEAARRVEPAGAADELTNAAVGGQSLKFWGGPVLAQVSVHPLFWNASTQFQTNLNAFYKAIPNSRYFDLLSPYGIQRGSGVNGVIDNRTATSVSDTAIHTELNRLFAAGILPLPNANNYYPVHFPAGVNITAPDGSKSCVVFCAYHGTYVRNGINVNYGVIPDQSGSCAGGCGANPSRVNNLDAVSSGELVDTVTDPAVGLAITVGSPLAWFDPTLGEIVDICGQQTTVVGGDGVTYVVEQFFSIATNTCVP